MALASQRRQPRMTVDLFRAFYASRPDEERWELIDGVAMMMAPATFAHQRIASNLERLLLDALEIGAPTLTALQAIGVNLAPSVNDYDPEPDVVVIDAAAAEKPGERYADRFYLAAEIISASDRVEAENKRDIYKLHEFCNCILIVQQGRYEVRVSLRSNDGWSELTMTQPDDLLALPEFGLRCRIADLYRGTALQPRQG
ncbi:MAG: Uma2 family endonuclease, partial [Sphingomonadaceae bacterium]